MKWKLGLIALILIFTSISASVKNEYVTHKDFFRR